MPFPPASRIIYTANYVHTLIKNIKTILHSFRLVLYYLIQKNNLLKGFRFPARTQTNTFCYNHLNNVQMGFNYKISSFCVFKDQGPYNSFLKGAAWAIFDMGRL